jgi:hypothetical protein
MSAKSVANCCGGKIVASCAPIGARLDAVHDARLRTVEGGREKTVSIVEREKDPVGHDRIEQIVREPRRNEARRRILGDPLVQVEEARSRERDETAAPPDHVDDADAPL